jgi:hypothetical protein
VLKSKWWVLAVAVILIGILLFFTRTSDAIGGDPTYVGDPYRPGEIVWFQWACYELETVQSIALAQEADNMQLSVNLFNKAIALPEGSGCVQVMDRGRPSQMPAKILALADPRKYTVTYPEMGTYKLHIYRVVDPTGDQLYIFHSDKPSLQPGSSECIRINRDCRYHV